MNLWAAFCAGKRAADDVSTHVERHRLEQLAPITSPSRWAWTWRCACGKHGEDYVREAAIEQHSLHVENSFRP